MLKRARLSEEDPERTIRQAIAMKQPVFRVRLTKGAPNTSALMQLCFDAGYWLRGDEFRQAEDAD